MKTIGAAALLLTALLFGCERQSKDADIQAGSVRKIEKNSIVNLYDAFGKPHPNLIKDFGFSAMVNYRDKIILFDGGTNADILRTNVEALGLSLSDVDIAVGSHSHGDHLNGFDYLVEVNPDVKIYLPFDFYAGADIPFDVTGQDPDADTDLPLEMKYFEGNSGEYQRTINQSGRFWKADVEFIDRSISLDSGVSLLFTRSPFLGYASKYPSVQELPGVDSPGDEIKFAGLPELSLVLDTPSGAVLVVGCSHSSVQNIIEENTRFQKGPVALLYGGYHMLPYGQEEVSIVAKMLKENYHVKKVAPAHCTGHIAFKEFLNTYGDNYVFAGLGETVSFE